MQKNTDNELMGTALRFSLIIGLMSILSDHLYANSGYEGLPPSAADLMREGDQTIDLMQQKIREAKQKKISENEAANYIIQNCVPKIRHVYSRMEYMTHLIPRELQNKWLSHQRRLMYVERTAMRMNIHDPDPFNARYISDQNKRKNAAEYPDMQRTSNIDPSNRSVASIPNSSGSNYERSRIASEVLAKNVHISRSSHTDEYTISKNNLSELNEFENLINKYLSVPQKSNGLTLDTSDIKSYLQKIKEMRVKYASKSYHVHILEQQRELCEYLLNATNTKDVYLDTHFLKSNLEKIRVKYQVLDTH